MILTSAAGRHAPGNAAAGALVPAPSAGGGNVSITPDSGNVSTTAASPTIVLGSISLNLGNQTGLTSTAASPTVVESSGNVAVTPASADTLTTASITNVIKGSITIDLGGQTGLTSSADVGTIVKGNITIDLSGEASLTSTAASPGIVLGNSTLTPDSADATTTANIRNIIDQPPVTVEEKASGWMQKYHRMRGRR